MSYFVRRYIVLSYFPGVILTSGDENGYVTCDRQRFRPFQKRTEKCILT